MLDRKLKPHTAPLLATAFEEARGSSLKWALKPVALFLVAAASLCAQNPSPKPAEKSSASLVRGQWSRTLTPGSGKKDAISLTRGQRPNALIIPELAKKSVTSTMPTGTSPGNDSRVTENSQTSGIVYTCDATINAVPGVCTYLNGTVASLYSSAFTNTNANIYITFGSTSLGESETELNILTYSQFRTALIANESGSNDVTAVTDSVPATEPAIFGNDDVVITNADARALGFSPSGGITSTLADCTLGTAGCYDGIITISSAEQTAGNLYYRIGNITSGQFDFYTVVEHETDEVLGTMSCSQEGCVFSGITYLAPADLFRYSSNDARIFNTSGANTSCASSSSTNACFSLDGTHMLQQYNNLANGEDTGDWATNCSAPLVQDAEGCPGVANVNISPAAEILVLDVVGFNLPTPGSPTGLNAVVADATYGNEVLKRQAAAGRSDIPAAKRAFSSAPVRSRSLRLASTDYSPVIR